MSIALRALITTFAFACTASGARAAAPTVLELEGDLGSVTSNTLQRPNDATGTRFDLTDLSGRRLTAGRLGLAIPTDWGRDGAELRFTFAPLQESGTGAPPRALRYQGAVFVPGAPVTALYQFNTWRVTWDAPVLVHGGDWELRAGATLALRDAQIRLKQQGLARNYVNYGPVPLAYAAVTRRLGPGWRVSLAADGFPAPGGGGLLDATGRIEADLGRHAAAFVGVRQVSGGASGGDLFTFLHVTTGTAGLQWRW